MKIFIVMDHGVVDYAGHDFSNAKRKVKGGSKIKVWQNNVWIGDIDTNGDWVFKTKYYKETGGKDICEYCLKGNNNGYKKRW